MHSCPVNIAFDLEKIAKNVKGKGTFVPEKMSRVCAPLWKLDFSGHQDDVIIRPDPEKGRKFFSQIWTYYISLERKFQCEQKSLWDLEKSYLPPTSKKFRVNDRIDVKT